MADLPWGNLAIGAGIFVASTLLSMGIVVLFLVRIRPDYFVVHERGLSRRMRRPAVRVLYLVGKNLLGVVLVIAGVVLSLPGVPGQGLLTILVGVLLLDIPAKRNLELRLVRKRRVLHAINKLRDRFGAAPLEVEESPHPNDPP